jgi:hypothetical protein
LIKEVLKALIGVGKLPDKPPVLTLGTILTFGFLIIFGFLGIVASLLFLASLLI